MKTPATRSAELLRIARYYYDEDFSMSEIARRVGLSSVHVKRLLKDARNQGIVSIEFHAPKEQQLAQELKRQFPCLREAVVVATESQYDLHTKALARAAADYFDERLMKRSQTTKVGLSGGLTVFEFAKAVPERRRNIALYPTAILSRGDAIVSHIDPIASLTTLWGKSGYQEGRLYFVTVTPLEMIGGQPLTVEQVQEQNRALLLREKVKRLFDAMAGVDMVFASLRQFDTPRSAKKKMGAMALDLLSDIGIGESSLDGAVGDLNYSFINSAGSSRPEWELFIGLTADHLREMAQNSSKEVVVIAGRQKQKVLRAALAGGLLNVLITDRDTAGALLQEDD